MKEDMKARLSEAQDVCVQEVENGEKRLDLIRRAGVAMDEAQDLMEQAETLA